MNIIATIPARHAATRLPGKLMKLIGNKTIIRHSYENVLNTGLFGQVWVVTDHELIYNEIKYIGGNVLMSRQEHQNGSERIAEAIEAMPVDAVVNVQGDEPFIQKPSLAALVKLLQVPSVNVASLMRKISDGDELQNPACVKVVVDKNNQALYFSRSAIPYNQAQEEGYSALAHIGVYGYKKAALLDFVKLPAAPLETIEKLEQLRFLHHGIAINMALTEFKNISIDTPDDLLEAEKYYSQLNKE